MKSVYKKLFYFFLGRGYEREIDNAPRGFRQPKWMGGLVAGDPGNPLARAQQRPALARPLGEFDIGEKIRQFLRMAVHAKRLETVSVTAQAQGQATFQLVRVQPDLERIIVILHLFARQRGDVPQFAGEFPAAGQFHLTGDFERDDIRVAGKLRPALERQNGRFARDEYLVGFAQETDPTVERKHTFSAFEESGYPVEQGIGDVGRRVDALNCAAKQVSVESGREFRQCGRVKDDEFQPIR